MKIQVSDSFMQDKPCRYRHQKAPDNCIKEKHDGNRGNYYSKKLIQNGVSLIAPKVRKEHKRNNDNYQVYAGQTYKFFITNIKIDIADGHSCCPARQFDKQ